jgi:tetratricopeptide (TPR) repeat protein
MNDSLRRRNPYIIGRPITEPDLFFGRETLFQFVADNLLQGSQVILLHGQRRIGKSSVLAQLPYFMSKFAHESPYADLDQFVFVALSLEGDSRKPVGEVLHELARDSLDHYDGVRSHVSVPSIEQLSRDPQLFVDRFLPEFRAALGAKNVVLLLDEFDALGDYQPAGNDAAGHLFPFLKSEVYGHPDLFIIPVVGRQLQDLSSLFSLFREAPYREVGLLTARSTSQLIQVPARGLLDYHPDAINLIWDFTAGHPYFTQLMGFALFSQAREEDRWFVRAQDVEDVVKRAIELGEGGLGWFWSGIPLPERVVFSAAAEVPEEKLENAAIVLPSAWEFTESEPLDLLKLCGVEITDPIRGSVSNLVNWKFLQSTGVLRPRVRSSLPPKVSKYRVTIELVRRWLVKKHPVREEIRDELSKLYPEAEQLYETAKRDRQDSVTPKVISQLQQALKLNPNHFGVLLELASSLTVVREFAAALPYYDRAYKMHPMRVQDDYVEALCSYADDLRYEQRFDDAIAQLQDALEIKPGNSKVMRLLDEIDRARQLDEKLKINPPLETNGNGRKTLPNISEVDERRTDLELLRHQFDQLTCQVSTLAPQDLRDRALERLDDLRQELFNEREVDMRTLAYVHGWFSKNLPGAIAHSVTEFVSQVVAQTVGDDEPPVT